METRTSIWESSRCLGPVAGRPKPQWLRSSSLSAAFRAHNTWVAAVLWYYVVPVEWGVRELSQVDVRTRSMLVKCGSHVPTASKDRLYLPRNECGIGLTNVQLMAEREVVGAAIYLKLNGDQQVRGEVQAMKVMEQRLVRMPISRAREMLQKYGVPHDVFMWEGEAPGPKKVQQMLLRASTRYIRA